MTTIHIDSHEIEMLNQEIERLTAELGDLPEAQADTLAECKRLRDERDAALVDAKKLKQRIDVLYTAWHAIGADVAGLKWADFVRAIDEAIAKEPTCQQ